MDNKLSIIIPCYNEGDKIAKTLQTVIDQMYRWQLEIVVVDDGSTDNTREQVLRMCSMHMGKIMLISYNHNVGKGYAVASGLQEARFKQKLIIDADLSVNPSELEYLKEEEMWGNCIIKGQRVQVVRQPFIRIFLGKGWKVLVWMFTGLYMDTQCPFTFLRLPQDFYDELVLDGFAFDVEILYLAKRRWPIYHIDVDYHNDEDSSVTAKKTIEMFKELLILRFGKRTYPHTKTKNMPKTPKIDTI